jgi:hypothetical protein
MECNMALICITPNLLDLVGKTKTKVPPINILSWSDISVVDHPRQGHPLSICHEDLLLQQALSLSRGHKQLRIP